MNHDEIRKALAAATPVPWCYEPHCSVVTGPEGEDVCRVYHECNTVLIENAPTWLSWCLDQIERRDAMLCEFIEDVEYRDRCEDTAPSNVEMERCAEARKLLEESK